jgi:hypothetical protein
MPRAPSVGERVISSDAFMNNPPEGGLRQPRLLLRQQFSSIHGGGRGVSDTRHAGEAVAWSSSFRDQCRGSPAVPITTSRPRVFGSAVETLSTNRRAPDLARRLERRRRRRIGLVPRRSGRRVEPTCATNRKTDEASHSSVRAVV